MSKKTKIPHELLAVNLQQMLDSMKRIYGDKWADVTRDYREFLTEVMKQTGNDNPLSAMIPVAKGMSADGENPLLLIVTAADMAASEEVTHAK